MWLVAIVKALCAQKALIRITKSQAQMAALKVSKALTVHFVDILMDAIVLLALSCYPQTYIMSGA